MTGMASSPLVLWIVLVVRCTAMTADDEAFDTGINDTIVKLEHFNERDTLTLLDVDHSSYPVQKAALRRCPYFDKVFKEQKNLRELRVEARREELQIFFDFLADKTTYQIDNAFGVIKFANSIECDEFTRYCIEATTGIGVLNEKADLKTLNLVRKIVKAIPTRTADQYEKAVSIYAKDTQKLLIDAIVAELKVKAVPLHRPLPLPVFLNKVTVAIMTDIRGNNVTAALVNRRWVPIDLFGRRFCPMRERVKNFYLSFGRYVIYESANNSVIKRDIGSNKSDVILFTACKYFAAQRNRLVVIQHDELRSRDVLYEWDHDLLAFIERFSHSSWKLRNALIGADNKLVVQLDNGHAVIISEDGRLQPLSGCTTFSETVSGRICISNGSLQFIGDGWPAKRIDHLGYTILETNTGQDAYETTVYMQIKQSALRLTKSIYSFGRYYSPHYSTPASYGSIGPYDSLNRGANESYVSATTVRQEACRECKTELHGRVICFSDVLIL